MKGCRVSWREPVGGNLDRLFFGLFRAPAPAVMIHGKLPSL